MSSAAEHFLELLLKFRPELAASFEQTALDREQFRVDLLSVPGVVEVHPSGGNFLLTRLDAPTAAGQVLRRALLADAAIEVKDVSDRIPSQAAHLRIAVRKPAENQRFLEALRRLLASEVLSPPPSAQADTREGGARPGPDPRNALR
jgi:histidinol-phosphate/aromatic aminotransferase/cobyric acid decarboxylase-like protein